MRRLDSICLFLLINLWIEVKHNKVAVLLTVDTNRDGNQADVDRLTKLLPKLGYDTVINPKNPTKKQMITTLQDLTKLKGSYDVTHSHSNFLVFTKRWLGRKDIIQTNVRF